MSTITRNYTTAVDAAIVEARVRRLTARAAKKGMTTDLTAATEVTEFTNEITGETEYTYTVTVSFTDMVRFDGGWVLTAVADATATDEPMVFTLDDTTEAPTDVDMMRCDHCGRRARRSKVLFVTNDAGDEKQVGGSCAKDFLGHDPWWTTVLFDALDDEITDGDRSRHDGFPTSVVIAAAIEAYRLGYTKADAQYGLPNRTIVRAMLTGAIGTEDFKDVREALRRSSPATMTVDEVRTWMTEQDGVFGANLRAIANSETVGSKVIGITAYAPAGFDNWRTKVAQEADASENEVVPVPTTNDRVIVTGTVTKAYSRVTDWGIQYKMVVKDDRGFTVCGTEPSNLSVEVGDRVTFTARVTKSEQDPTFGFYNRPTKAQVLA